jgi:hypothetical protein
MCGLYGIRLQNINKLTALSPLALKYSLAVGIVVSAGDIGEKVRRYETSKYNSRLARLRGCEIGIS